MCNLKNANFCFFCQKFSFLKFLARWEEPSSPQMFRHAVSHDFMAKVWEHFNVSKLANWWFNQMIIWTRNVSRWSINSFYILSCASFLRLKPFKNMLTCFYQKKQRKCTKRSMIAGKFAFQVKKAGNSRKFLTWTQFGQWRAANTVITSPISSVKKSCKQ